MQKNHTQESIHRTVERQREFFGSGSTLSVKWRIAQLRKLRKSLIESKDELSAAIRQDLGRSETEAYLCDIVPTILEIDETIRGLRRWARPERHFSGLMCFPSIVTKVYKLPYGVTLIISPFNFPVLLTLGVLVASIAGGNTAVIKTSSKSSACTAALERFIASTFPEEYVCLIEGGHDIADRCLKERFDKIFYTGSPAVGRHILAQAAPNLTPVAMELGGENGNWCIVRKDANLRDAARKIAFFKSLNAGQICIDINQVAVAREVAEQFLEYLKEEFTRQAGPAPESNPDYPRLITQAAFEKCEATAKAYSDRIIFGGTSDGNSLKYSPTVIYPVGADEDIVKHELFSPLLPIVPFKDCEVDKILQVIASREHPLATYIFTKDIRWAEKVMSSLQFGGGCINEVCMHLMVKGVPFNGVGHSGMGAYHGKWGFREFTHPQTVLKGCSHFNLSLREHPYDKKWKLKILRRFFV